MTRLAKAQQLLLDFGEPLEAQLHGEVAPRNHQADRIVLQGLDSATRTGLPTRAEVTDAAMAMRAECVMLGKGPHIAIATRMLADIIQKMEAHQFKRRSMMRPLAVALRQET
jgi:hypothetical protein